MKNGTGILLEPILVKVKGWDTYITLQSTTKLRDIKRVRGTWRFEASAPKDRTWTACTTKHDLEKALGLK